jgi:hypothetical protein
MLKIKKYKNVINILLISVFKYGNNCSAINFYLNRFYMEHRLETLLAMCTALPEVPAVIAYALTARDWEDISAVKNALGIVLAAKFTMPIAIGTLDGDKESFDAWKDTHQDIIYKLAEISCVVNTIWKAYSIGSQTSSVVGAIAGAGVGGMIGFGIGYVGAAIVYAIYGMLIPGIAEYINEFFYPENYAVEASGVVHNVDAIA